MCPPTQEMGPKHPFDRWVLSNREGPAFPQKSHGKSGAEFGIRPVSPSHNFPDGLMDESNDLFFRTTVLVLVWPHEEDTLPHGSGAWPLRKSP